MFWGWELPLHLVKRISQILPSKYDFGVSFQVVEWELCV